MKFILVKGKSFVSKLIEWQTRGEFSHAALLFSDGTVIESRERHFDPFQNKHVSGVGKLSFTDWKAMNAGTPFIVFEVQMAAFEEEIIRKFADVQVGKPYDYWGVARFITRKNYQSQPDDKWWCSEIVFQAILQAVNLFKNTEGWQVAPDLLKRTPFASICDS